MGCIFFTAILLMLFSTAKAHSQPFAYVTNQFDDTISVINLSTNTVVDTINVGTLPQGLAATPDGQFVYVTNNTSNNISVIQTSGNTVVDTIAVGDSPTGIGIFIRPEAPVETAPTLSQWGIILFALFSGLLAVRFIRGKQGLGIGS